MLIRLTTLFKWFMRTHEILQHIDTHGHDSIPRSNFHSIWNPIVKTQAIYSSYLRIVGFPILVRQHLLWIGSTYQSNVPWMIFDDSLHHNYCTLIYYHAITLTVSRSGPMCIRAAYRSVWSIQYVYWYILTNTRFIIWYFTCDHVTKPNLCIPNILIFKALNLTMIWDSDRIHRS